MALSLRQLVALRSLPHLHAPELRPEARHEVVQLVADNALAAFILTQVALKRSARLARWVIMGK